MTFGKDSYYEDRRAHKRFQVDCPVSVCFLGDFSIQKCVQISEGGMLLSAEKMDWAVGFQIEICILVPGNKSIILYAEVVYNLQLNEQGHYAGVRFLNLSKSAQDHLRHYISTLSAL